MLSRSDWTGGTASSRLVAKLVGYDAMDTVGSFEAKTHFAELLTRAEKGEEITITRRGKPVARLVPTGRGHDVAAAREAATRIRALARSLKLDPFDWEEWKGYRDEGRR